MTRGFSTPALAAITTIFGIGCAEAKEPPPAAAAAEPAPIVAPEPVAPAPEPAKPEPEPTPTEPEKVYLKVSIERSLEATFVKAVGDQFLGAQLAQITKRVLIWWIDVRRHLYPGDVLEIVYEQREEQEPLIHAIWFESGKLGGKRAAVLYKPTDGKFARWYDEQGREIEKRLKHSPIQSYEQITSLLSDGRRHRGVDFKAPIGQPIVAPFNGRVVRKNWSRRRNGTCLQITNGKGVDAYFLHLSRVKRDIRPGMKVKRGQTLAWSGNTGRSSAPHLHYQLEKNERVIDPFRFHATWRASLSEEERAKALSRLASLSELRTRST